MPSQRPRPHRSVAAFAAGCVAASLITGVAGGEASGRGRASCGPRTWPTVLATDTIRVYHRPHPSAAQRHDIYFCDEQTRQRDSVTRRASSAPVFPPPAIAAAGHTLAFAYDDLTDPDGAVTEIDVADLRPGRDLVAGPPAVPEAGVADVVSIRVTADGHAVWTACRSAVATRHDEARLRDDFSGARCRRAGTLTWVYTTDPAHPNTARLLGRSSRIAARSLRLHGRTAAWLDDGRLRHARI